jgi:Protein of unknown function with PCYCGC motif
MSPRNVSVRPPRARRLGALGGPLLIVVLALGGTMAGCSSSSDPAMGGDHASIAAGPAAAGGTTAASVPMGDMHMPTADEVTATWKARPDYVKALPAEWQGAYAFALARPEVLQWLPCYCGCTAMGHRSNLDCFFQRRDVAGNYQYEEHASYCDICVKTANMAQRMLQDGSTMIQVRAAVDTTFGGTAPGTDTPLPPAS